MNNVNPYEPPPAEVAPAKPHDPLAFPMFGFYVFSAIAFLLGAWLVSVAMYHRHLAILRGGAPASGVYDILRIGVWIIVVSLLTFACARCLHKRRWRWYVIAFSLLTFLPFTGFVMIPLGVLTLVRLRQKRVWNSFQTGSGRGNA